MGREGVDVVGGARSETDCARPVKKSWKKVDEVFRTIDSARSGIGCARPTLDEMEG